MGFVPFSSSARAMQPSAIRRMLALSRNKSNIISFAAGQPNPQTFPLEQLRDLTETILRDEGPEVFEYLPTRGLPALVEEVTRYARAAGISIHHDELLVTEGSQQGIDLIARVFVDPGDSVLVELPSYVGALSAFRAAQAHLAGVRLDHDGLDLEHLRARVHQLRRAGRPTKLLYVIPSFQNPSGQSYTVARRTALLALANELDLWIVEDDPYGELCFSGTPQPTLASLDTEGRVIYLSSFSKLLAPGLRVGFLVGPTELLAKIEIAKQSANLCGSGLDQRIVLAALEADLISEQKARIRPFYRARCEALLHGLATEMPSGVTWTKPEGGLFVWLTLPAPLDAEAMLQHAVDHGVAYVAGGSFFVEDVQPNTMRLTFATASELQIAEGVRRLAMVVRAEQRRQDA